MPIDPHDNYKPARLFHNGNRTKKINPNQLYPGIDNYSFNV